MTDQLRQAEQQALENLEKLEDLMEKSITALRKALAQEHALHDLARLGQEIEQGKRGSIALARSLCYEIAGATSEDDIDGGGYGSVDIAEILSAEVLRLQKALAQLEQQAAPPQREWQGLTPEEVKHLYPYGRSVWGRETFEAIEAALKKKNT